MVRAAAPGPSAWPSPSQALAAVRRTVQPALPGLGIALASSVACAPLVAPLVAAHVASAGASQARAAWPLMGGILGAPAAGGALGVVCILVQFYTATLALISGEEPFDRRAKWALAHGVMGFGLSPLWCMAAGGAGVAAASAGMLAVGCGIGLAHLLTAALQRNVPSFGQGIMTLSLCVAGAPIAAQAAAGVGAAGLVLHVGLCLSIGAFLYAADTWRTAFAVLRSEGLALARRSLVELDHNCRLNLPVAEHPTVFVDAQRHQVLFDIVGSVTANVRRHQPFLQPPLLLSGPPGTGKTRIANALASHFGWPLFLVKRPLIDVEHPATRIAELFRQLRAWRDAHGTPIVVAFDEAEGFYPQAGEGHIGDEAQAKALAFNAEFEGMQSTGNHDILFIAMTNHPERIDDAMQSRFANGHIELSLPSAGLARQLYASKWKALHQGKAALRQQFAEPFAATPDDLDLFCQWAQCDGQMPAGRDIDAIVHRTLDEANAYFDRAENQGASPQDFAAFVRAHVGAHATAIAAAAHARLARGPAVQAP